MTRHLDEVVEKVKRLPDDKQRDAADLLTFFLDQQKADVQLTPEQIAEVRRRLEEPDDFVSEEEMNAFFAKLGA